MSYTRHFRKNITVHYSGSVSYPASEHGGTTHYSGSTTESIDFEVHVNTEPFDAEVDDMKHHVDLLTGSVAATEAAHVKSIGETSKKIGDTIISGFFKTVQSDISQQIAELKSRSEALLVQLKSLADRCNDKKKQMGVDYQRLAERYGKIFTDLNNELKNRIYSIDEPVFNIVGTLDSVGSQTGQDDSVTTVSITSGENSKVHSLLAVNYAKRQALNAIEKGRKFLDAQYACDRVIDRCLRPGGESTSLYTPFCVIDTVDGNGSSSSQVFSSPLLQNVEQEELVAKIDSFGWESKMNEDEARAISDYFSSNVAQAMQNATNEHDRRVADMTSKLFNLSSTALPGKK